jgi:hypothetical protein
MIGVHWDYSLHISPRFVQAHQIFTGRGGHCRLEYVERTEQLHFQKRDPLISSLESLFQE